MLECTHAPLTPIRCKAKAEQSLVAMALLKVHVRSPNMTHFIREITSQCWSPLNPDISRLWLGTWTSDTLNGVLRQTPDTPMAMPTRAIYINIVKKLTKPLVEAYYSMLSANIKGPQAVHSDADPSPLQDHFPADNHSQATTLHSSHPLVLTMALPSVLRQEIEAMHIQEDQSRGLSLACTATLNSFTDFTLSNAALFMEMPAGTP